MSVRISVLAKEVGKDWKELIVYLNNKYPELQVRSHANTINDMYADEAREYFISLNNPIAKDESLEQKEPLKKQEPVKDDYTKMPKQVVKTQEEADEEYQRSKLEQEAKKDKSLEKLVPEQKSVSPLKVEEKTLEKKDSVSSPKVPSVPSSFAPKAPSMPAQNAPKAPSVPSGFAPKAPVSIDISSPRKTPMSPVMPSFIKNPSAVTEAKEQDVKKDTVLKQISIKAPIIVRDFAEIMGLKPFKLISELMEAGIFASMNQAIDEKVALQIAKKLGFDLKVKHRGEQAAPQVVKKKKEPEENPADLELRAPVVCIMGHVDHGKTTLLDTIRNARVAAGEAGGITQHTAAYQIERNGQKITFLDTPGHAAFSNMRKRGATVTDIAALVVAADDGFMPQTDEALKFIQESGNSLIIVINKIDSKGANIDKVKQEMQKRGIASEDWGGETLCCELSALKGDGIDNFLDTILLEAEMLELKANPKALAKGVVLESQIEAGFGASATAIVQNGTLSLGDSLVCGSAYCKVRALMDDKSKRLKSVLPGAPALVLGWNEAPVVGEEFVKFKNDKEAKKLAEENAQLKKKALLTKTNDEPVDINALFAAIENESQKVLKLIVKADVQGTAEALRDCFLAIKSDKVNLEIIDTSVGVISKNDIALASTSKATIIGFNVKVDNGVNSIAKHQGVEIILHNIIYELIDKVKEAMVSLLDPELKENILGKAQVRQIFAVSKGQVAGCMVMDGTINKDKRARVIRGKEVLHTGRVGTLKRFKDDVTEVKSGYECGLQVTGFNTLAEGDVIECFEILQIRPQL